VNFGVPWLRVSGLPLATVSQSELFWSPEKSLFLKCCRITTLSIGVFPQHVFCESYMEALWFLIPLSVVVVLAIGGVFWWSVRSGQFDDLDSPAYKILVDDDTPFENSNEEKDGECDAQVTEHVNGKTN
jgi:cbb3-type cytochrome oxidase maturation protein